MSYIDKSFWQESLKKPDWYVLLANDFKRLEKMTSEEKDYKKRKLIKNEAYSLVEDAYRNGMIAIASKGENLDKERKPIDTLVIHHTANRPGMTLSRLNAIQLLRIYGRYFEHPTDKREQYLSGSPVWSGHFYKDKQIFWGYHWFIRNDGSTEQILDDKYIGWQAGNWDINTRSIGICIDDDLSDKSPSDAVISAVAAVISKHYKTVEYERIYGHCDINKTTECPGSQFHEKWRQQILQKLSS